MKRSRLTREQRRAETRERLLAAAHTHFIGKGYAATSIEDIACAAGYTRGAFYSNFEGKLEVLVELLCRDHDRTRARFVEIIGRSQNELEAHIVEYLSRHSSDDAAFPLWIEASLLAIRDAELRERLRVFTHEKREQAAACINALTECVGASLPLPARTLAHGLVSLCDGVRLFQMCDPDTIDTISEVALAGFFSKTLSR